MTAALLPAKALADESTTTIKTAYKDLSDHTEIYVLTTRPGSSYPAYGALYEPEGGVLYGRTDPGGTLPSGRYGLINQDEMKDESVVSHYYSLAQCVGDYSLSYWSYLYGVALTDEEHTMTALHT